MIQRENFLIASAGTLSNALGGNGKRLVGVYLPTIDSATIGFVADTDGGTTYDDIFTNTGAPAAVTLGNADTGSSWRAVPEDVGRISAVVPIKLKASAAQNGGARTIIGVWEAP